MKKHLLTFVFILVCISCTTAQLTLQKVGNKTKKVIPIGTLIEVKLPTKTSRPDCECFQSYTGELKKSSDNAVELVLTQQDRITVDENNVDINERKFFHYSKDSVITQIPLTKPLTITYFSKSNLAYRDLGGVLTLLAVASNLFIAPHFEPSISKPLRNIGYGAMALGISTALLKTKKVYHLQQPKSGKKTLWKLNN